MAWPVKLLAVLLPVLAIGCQAAPQAVQGGDVDPSTLPVQYRKAPDIKAAAKTVYTGKGYFASGLCTVGDAVADAIRYCEQTAGASCTPYLIGHYDVAGKDHDGIRRATEEYQSRFEALAAPSDPRQAEAFRYMASLKPASQLRRLRGGRLTVDFTKRCGGGVHAEGEDLVCFGQWDYGGRVRPAERYPQGGEMTLECDDGRAYSGAYVLNSEAAGRAKLLAKDGSEILAIYSKTGGIQMPSIEEFDRRWAGTD